MRFFKTPKYRRVTIHQFALLRFRIVVLGGAAVGKSSIIRRFLEQDFQPEYRPTVEDMHTAAWAQDGHRIELNILDTAGAYSFPAMRRLAIMSADAFVLVFSVDQAGSFEEVVALREEILSLRETDASRVPIVIVSNKCDLVTSHNEQNERIEFLANIQALGDGYVETSVQDNLNVDTVFRELLRRLEELTTNTSIDFASCVSTIQQRRQSRGSLSVDLSEKEIKHLRKLSKQISI